VEAHNPGTELKETHRVDAGVFMGPPKQLEIAFLRAGQRQRHPAGRFLLRDATDAGREMTTLAKKLTRTGVVEWQTDNRRFVVTNATEGPKLAGLDRYAMRRKLGLAFLRAERERQQTPRQAPAPSNR
jgi:predicted ATPase